MGIVHRNIKPENIMLYGETYKLSGFGCAANFKEAELRGVSGTSHYIAPEVLLSGETLGTERTSYDERCDLWSCGVLLHLLLSAKLPFEGTHVS